MTTFTKFADCNISPVEKDNAHVVISGNPVHTSWLHFSGNNDTFRSGIWESTAGVFHGPMNNQIEYCYIIEGEAVIHTEDGKEFTVQAGDGFVMDNGLKPVWHVKDRVKKHFVIQSVTSIA